MDWAHLFMPNDGSGNADGSTLDTDPALLLPTSDFFENLPLPSTVLPLQPPSIPPDLEPSPLFASPTDQQTQASSTNIAAQNQQISTSDSQHTQHTQQQQQQQQQASAAANILAQQQQLSFLADAQQIEQTSQPGAAQPPAPIDTLFDTNEESYLQSFLSSFDADGFDIGTYLGSPPPMPNFSARSDLTSMGMGMGVGAGMLGTMDDAIPHLSLDEAAHDGTQNFARMNSPGASGAHSRGTVGGMVPMQRRPYFDYSLGSTAPLSLGNVMSEELHKVSSWLMQNQDHQSETYVPNSAPLSSMPSTSQFRDPQTLASLAMAGPATAGMYGHDQMYSPSGFSSAFPMGSVMSPTVPTSATLPYPKPSSESEMSVKRKASHDQVDQPRKNRGGLPRPPLHEAPIISTGGMLASSRPSPATPMMSVMSPQTASFPGTSPAADGSAVQETREKAMSFGDSDDGMAGIKRRDSKKNSQRVILTEDERRANHIASEQRRRNQIRQGYAELMTLVTTLRDPALGNHPGTAQSTPSKAVILSHAVQFIRGLEEGNRILRKRLEGTPHSIPPMHFATQHLAAFHQHHPSPSQ